MKIAVVTGASSGMGREFANQLDAQQSFDEIWVIARRKEKLEELSAGLRAKLRAISLDLASEGGVEEYKKLLETQKPEVAVLVNASGFGKFNYFTDVSLEDYYRMIDLNDKALVGMTYVTLPYMKDGSSIYQMGSLSSFQPVPYINLYGATKAFVLSFSRALNVELHKKGIRVMAVCPGWVKTDFFNTAVSDNSITYYNRYYEAADVVKKALADMKRGKDVSILGFPVRVQVFFTKLLPHRLIMKIWMKQQKHD